MSPPSFNLEGHLTLTVETADGAVRAASLSSQRPVTASNILVGKTPQEVLTLLPLVFSLCGKAQRTAGLLAIERALAVAVNPGHMAARRMIVAAESGAENARRVLLDWPQLVGASPDLSLLMPIRGRLGKIEATLYPDGDAAMPGGGRLSDDYRALASLIDDAETAIKALAPGFDPHASLSAFDAWVRHGADGCAALFRGLPETTVGAALPFLKAGQVDVLAARMGADDAPSFLARPDIGGVVYETGPLAEQVATPLIAEMLAARGAGMVVRFAARLAALMFVPTVLRQTLEMLDGKGVATDWMATSGDVAMVDTARGWLAHRVTVDNGKITGYRILAPTEWNFHPQGVLPEALAGASYKDEADLKRLIDLWVAALDPCVACQVDFAGGDHGATD